MTTPKRGRPQNPRDNLLGAAITKAREYAKMDQYEFAAKLGVSQSTVSDWETGRIDPPSSRLMAIAKLCRVPLSEYLK